MASDILAWARARSLALSGSAIHGQRPTRGRSRVRCLQVAVQSLVHEAFGAHLIQRRLQPGDDLIGHVLVQRQIQLGTVEAQNGLQARDALLLGQVATGRVSRRPELYLPGRQLARILLVTQRGAVLDALLGQVFGDGIALVGADAMRLGLVQAGQVDRVVTFGQ